MIRVALGRRPATTAKRRGSGRDWAAVVTTIGWHWRDRPEPVLEQVLLPERHEFPVAVPEAGLVHGYVLNYEIWDQFVRVNTALVDVPLGAIRDRPALQLADELYTRLVEGSGGGGNGSAPTRRRSSGQPHGAAMLGLGGGHLGRPEKGVRFTPIIALEIP